jgi:two-component system, sensor histidine kinase and response regulator
VEFLVRDTGVGLEPGVRERIFEPFWQVEQPITRRSGGTGLGLTLTRRLVRLLDGEIRVESTPGEGSLFAVRLPLEQPTDAPAPEPAPGDPR